MLNIKGELGSNPKTGQPCIVAPRELLTMRFEEIETEIQQLQMERDRIERMLTKPDKTFYI